MDGGIAGHVAHPPARYRALGGCLNWARWARRPRPYHSRITHSRHRTALWGHQRTPSWSISYSRGRRRSLSDPGGRAPTRFGTVRPRVQIPGPRPFFELRISASDGSHAVAVAQGGHRFSWNSVAAAPSKWITDRRLNSLTALAQPIYQHAHGPRTVRHLGLKIKGAVHARVLPTHRPGP